MFWVSKMPKKSHSWEIQAFFDIKAAPRITEFLAIARRDSAGRSHDL